MRSLQRILPVTGLALPVLLLASASGCEPSITSDTYYCGPEKLCPPGLRCHLGPTAADDPRERASFAYSCVTEVSAQGFLCPENTSDQEPDDEASEGLDLMTLECGSQVAQSNWGCIDSAGDLDHYKFSQADVCVGSNPRFQAILSYPIGTAPLSLDLLDSQGSLVDSASLCENTSAEGGTEERCIDEPSLPLGDYVLRVQVAPDSNADCSGSCAFNRYKLRISTPVS